MLGGVLSLGKGSEIERIEGELGVLIEVLDVVNMEVGDASESGVEQHLATSVGPFAGTIKALSRTLGH
jgi:hypothetical protein